MNTNLSKSLSEPLAFSLNTQVIYLTSDPSVNQLVLRVQNVSGQPINLVGGTPVSEDTITGSDPSTVYFDFGGLISPSEFQNLVIKSSDANWEATYWGSSHPPVWGLSAAANATLLAGDTIDFALTNLLPASDKPGPGQVFIDYWNMPDAGDNNTGPNIPLNLADAPTNPTSLDIGVDFVGNNVVRGTDALVLTTTNPNNPISNTLSVRIANNASTALVPNGQWANPQFLLSFVVCPDNTPGYGALAPADMVANQVQASVDDTANWMITPSVQNDIPLWILAPTAANSTILAPSGSNNSAVTVTFSNVQTALPLPQPMNYDVTSLQVQSVNIPNTNDTVVPALIYKAPQPSIPYFFSDPANPTVTDTQVTLWWETQNAANVKLIGGNGIPSNPPVSGSAEIPYSQNESILLTAYNVVSGSDDAGNLTQTFQAINPIITTSSPAISIVNWPVYLDPTVAFASVASGNKWGIYFFGNSSTSVGLIASAMNLGYSAINLGYYVLNSDRSCTFVENTNATTMPILCVTTDGSNAFCGSVTNGNNGYNYFNLCDCSVAWNSAISQVTTNVGDSIYDQMAPCGIAFNQAATLFMSVCIGGTFYPYRLDAQPGAVYNSQGIGRNASYANADVASPAIRAVYSDNVHLLITGSDGISVLDSSQGCAVVTSSNGHALTSSPMAVSADGLRVYGVDSTGPLEFAIDPTNNYAITISRPFARPIASNPWVALSPDGRYLYIADSATLTIHDTQTLVSVNGTQVYLSTAIRGVVQSGWPYGAVIADPQDSKTFHYFSSTNTITACRNWTTVTLNPWPFPA